MKKNYTSPKIKLIKVNTENVMAGLSNTNTTTPDGKPTDGPNTNIGTWDGSDIETAKDNGGNDLWDNEN
ncbi:hypothetical protein [Prevotella sp.]|uniref:hypothetical protein n=1 Tax=uncultured Prevotella sp. TaxID=159272 RepID=UPI002804D2F0|nr:hypothetical protein [uncultured Prevotella sp.]